MVVFRNAKWLWLPWVAVAGIVEESPESWSLELLHCMGKVWDGGSQRCGWGGWRRCAEPGQESDWHEGRDFSLCGGGGVNGVMGVVYVFRTMFLVSGRGELYRSGFFFGWRCHFWVEWVFCGGGGGSWSADGGGSGSREFRTVSGVCYKSVSVVFEWEGGFSRNIRVWCWWKWMCLM